MSKSAKGTVEHQKETQNAQAGYNAPSQAYMENMWQAANAAGKAGPSPLVTGAAGYNTGAMTAGNMGMGALSGDPNATQQLMNPYLSNVVGGVNNQWDQNDAHTMNAVADRATQANAFGGSRQGVATGVALGQNNLNRNSQVGGLLYGGYNDAMNRAGTLAGYGAGASAANANLGMGGVGSPEQWYLQQLKQGWQGPTGTQSSGVSSQTGGSASAGWSTNPFDNFR